MKVWLVGEAEPEEWIVNAQDKTLNTEGIFGIEIQRDETPGQYCAEISNLKIWTPKGK